MEPVSQAVISAELAAALGAADRFAAEALEDERRWLRWSGVLPLDGPYAVVDEPASWDPAGMTVVRRTVLEPLLLDPRELAAVIAGAEAVVTADGIALALAAGYGVPHAWLGSADEPAGMLAAATGALVESTEQRSAAIGAALARTAACDPGAVTPFRAATPTALRADEESVSREGRRRAIATALRRAEDERVGALERAAAAEAEAESLRVALAEARRLAAELQGAVVTFQLAAVRARGDGGAPGPSGHSLGRVVRVVTRRVRRTR